MTEERRVPHQDELDLLREESESLAEFLLLLQREHRQLQADFVAILHAAGGEIRVPAADTRTAPDGPRIERVEDLDSGAVTFRLNEVSL
jgi:predicted  nucleic acid-binding Zn-ribbon protein